MCISPCLCPSQLWRRRKHTLQTLHQRYFNKGFKKVIKNKAGETNSQMDIQKDKHREIQKDRQTYRACYLNKVQQLLKQTEFLVIFNSASLLSEHLFL